MTQQAFGALVGVSQQAIGSLVGRGVIDQEMTGHQMLQAYCSHLREHAAGRASDGDLDLSQERAALARSQRETVDMKNAVTRGELAYVTLIEQVLSNAGSKIAGILEAIPGAVKRRVPSLPASEIKAISTEIARARNIVATMSLDDLREPAEGSDTPGADAHE